MVAVIVRMDWRGAIVGVGFVKRLASLDVGQEWGVDVAVVSRGWVQCEVMSLGSTPGSAGVGWDRARRGVESERVLVERGRAPAVGLRGIERVGGREALNGAVEDGWKK